MVLLGFFLVLFFFRITSHDTDSWYHVRCSRADCLQQFPAGVDGQRAKLAPTLVLSPLGTSHTA